MKIYNPTDIGDRNKLMILRLIKVYDGISRQEISKRMHLSAPAVSNNVAALIENGIVYENGCDDTSLGRKPRQLSYKGDLYYVISVELMPKKVRAGIADLYGEVQQWTEKEIIVENGVDEVLGQLDSAIDELLEKRKKDVDVIAIAVGVPALTGQNDLNDLFGTYLPEWKNVDLKEHILQKYNVEAIIVNDVELALIGERERGVGKKQTNIVYIKYGEGFAARAIVDGYLLKGNNMAAGELGYYLESLEEMTDEFVCPGRFEKKVCQNIFSECGEKNGLSDLINKKPTAHMLEGRVDTVSISLNAGTMEEYIKVTRPSFGEEAFYAMQEFASECKKYVDNVVFTVVDVIGEEELNASRILADKLGTRLRIRKYES